MSWSAKQYTKFEGERTRAVRDLLSYVDHSDARVVADIGCGPGNSTELLAERFPGAKIIGIDSSAEMIEAAQKRLPGADFHVADITEWSDQAAQSDQADQFDVILANASLQWVPDHASLLPRLLAKLSPGGSLAVQVPDNQNEPAHVLMRQVASDGRWAAKLSNATNVLSNRQSAEWYFRTLSSGGCSVNLWRTTYFHVLSGPGAIVEWFKSTGLRPFLAPLTSDEQTEYLQLYKEEVSKAYATLPDGTVLLPFPRLFFVVTRAE